MTNEPEPLPAFLRSYEYVDGSRVRSLYAALSGGLPREASGEENQAKTLGAGVNVWGVTASAGRTRGDRSTVTHSLEETHFQDFEELAISRGFIREITEEAADPEVWETGEIQEIAPEDTIVSITAPAVLLDGKFILDDIRRFSAGFRALDPEDLGGHDTGVFDEIGKILPTLENLFTHGVVLQLFPCSTDFPDYGYLGNLLDRSDYIEPERHAMYTNYGAMPREWTVVGVVNRYGSEVRPPPTPGVKVIDGDGLLNRSALTLMGMWIKQFLEANRATLGPTSPGGVITPLAVYRTITTHSDFESD